MSPIPGVTAGMAAGTSPRRRHFAGLITALDAQAARTRAIVGAHALDDLGAPGERWEGADPPPLERILFHLLQEYARHVGRLDIASELARGPTGE